MYLELTQASADPTTGEALGPFSMNNLIGCSFQVVWDGTVTVDTVRVDASNDPRARSGGPDASSAKWTDVTSDVGAFTSMASPGGSESSSFINFTFGNYLFVRLYLATFGGTGNIYVFWKGPF